MVKVSHAIIYRIRGMGRGSAFTSGEFGDLGSRNAIDKALSRLQQEKVVRRLKPGLYDYPRTNKKLGGRLSPELDQVAKAIARKNGLRIQVTGAQAANLLGLSTQVPAKAVYLTDGPARKIKIDNREIVFRHVEPKRIRMSNSRSGMVLEALKDFGHEGIPDGVLVKLRRELSAREKQRLAKDAAKAPLWLRDVVLQIAGENN
jgi:hypothetical protein